MDEGRYIDYKAIGNRIRISRSNKGITQIKFAELLNVTPEYVSRIERATTKPNLTMLSKISGLLEVSLTYLLEGSAKCNADYKLEEFDEILKALTPVKRKLLYDFAEVLLKSQF